ncbi:extracellular solute-binding protein [Actinoallomurus rhizosphaericola]|uniref:extracellular solute-binding protein n=1 Tax=Actinoallomurus rhizosphaericola TaxID=2952536 RepID=UPI0020911E9C|nr:extracellular solute-binding protein [Actinoallomurus rhizosphaericola]MCO5992748.1 extracellular solute-binding protein [Actinoallomurus rhizosphaericola]
MLADRARRHATRRRRLAASVVAAALTLVVLPGVKWSLSYRPAVAGCGKHRGLVMAADVDVSPDFQRSALIDEWNKAHPDMPATLVEIARSTDEVRSQLTAAVGSGSCAYDVLLADVAWIPEYARRGLLTEVKASQLDDPGDFVPQTLQTGQWRGHQYAIPWYTDAGLLYVRQGDRAPSSWNDLLGRGYATQLKDYEGLTVNTLEVIWNTQQRAVLSGPIDKVDDRTAAIVLAGIDRLATANPILARSRSYEEDGSFEAFADHETGLMRNWPYAFRELIADPRVGDRFQVTTLPETGVSVLGGWDLAVSAQSRHKADSRALIDFLTSTDSQRRLFSCGGFTPSRTSAFEGVTPCPDKKYRPDELPSPQRFSQFAGTLQAALYHARPRPVTPYYAQFSETFRGCVLKVLGAHDGVPGARAPTPHDLARALTAALNGRQGTC